MSLKQIVQRSAKKLDKECPGWFRVIKITKLEMGHGFFCIVGQLQLKGLCKHLDDLDVSRGFYVTYSRDYMQNKAELIELWKSEIRSRRNNGKRKTIVKES